MLRGLRRIARAGILLRELKGIRTELQLLTQTLGRIASTLEAQHPSAHSQIQSPDDSVEVAYVDDAMQAELMEIELRLAQATGRPPNESQVMAEYERVHDLTPGTFGGSVS